MTSNGASERAPVTVPAFRARKGGGPPLVCVTAYDAPMARLAERAGVDAILVGDSLGPNVLGRAREIDVTVDDITHHAAAVASAITYPLLIADLPFMSYATLDDALSNSGRLLREGGAACVKLEGGAEVAHITAGLVARGIPVMGHVGLTPQSIHALGAYRVQGADLAGAQTIVDGARAHVDAGAFAVVLEAIPARLAQSLTAHLTVPTIGIGAGTHCDGQIQVIYDLLGFNADHVPRHTRVYADIAEQTARALGSYVEDVREGRFPTPANSFKLRRGVMQRLRLD